MLSAGRAGAFAMLRNLAEPTPGTPIGLLAQGSRECDAQAPGEGLQEAISQWPADGDPLWPALARHVARVSTPEDRGLLEELARNPEQRDPPLRWGLQYVVRGDLFLDDGTELTLDELCSELELPPLPYLEDRPPPLEVDWDEDD